MHDDLPSWRIDPDRYRLGRRARRVADEALGRRAEGVVESRLARGIDFIGLPIMNLVWRHKADTEMTMVNVVPVEEVATESLGVGDAAKPQIWMSQFR